MYRLAAYECACLDKRCRYQYMVNVYCDFLELVPSKEKCFILTMAPFSKTDKMKSLFKSLIMLFACIYSGIAEGQDFDAFIRQGDEFSDKRMYTEAADSYTDAIRLKPKNGFAYNRRGNAFLLNKQYDLAIEDHTTAIGLDPKDAYAYGNRGAAWRAKGAFDLAISDFDMALNLNPKNTWAYNSRGLAYQGKKDYASAIENFSACLAIDPNSAWAYLNRGTSYQYLKQFDLALNDLTNAIKIDGSNGSAFAWRGYVYGRMNNFEAAIEDYSTSIKLNAKDPISFNNRGLFYNRLGEYEKAVADYKACIEIDPQYGMAYIGVISPLLRLRHFDEAVGYYNAYIEKKLTSFLESGNNQYYQHYLKGLMLLQEDKNEDALESLLSASDAFGETFNEETKRSYIDILFLQGVALEKLNRTTDAQILYEQSLVIDSRQPDLEVVLQRLHELDSKTVQSDQSIPEISVITPSSSNVELASGTIEVVGRAKDVSGIEYVKINGEPVEKLEEDGLFISKVKLTSGENTWVITASDKNGNIASQSMVLNVTGGNSRGTAIVGSGDGKTSVVMETEPVYHAILIAEQNYDDPKIPDLQHPKRDALELGTILEKNYGFLAANIDTLFDKSREDIMMAIVKKSSSLNENENLIIFYAGHGIAEKDKFGDVDGYWIPSTARSGLSATYISTDDINKAIKRSNAKHILIIADACFSGAMTRALPADAAREVNRQYIIPSRKVMASGNLEPVPDNSKFILYLKKRLVENNEKYLAAQDLFSSFRTAVMSNSDTVPQYAAIKNVGDEGGEFIFIRKQ